MPAYEFNGGLTGSARPRIALPYVLYPESVEDLGFRDKELIVAFHNAVGRILAVLQGVQPHRIWRLIEYHFRSSQGLSSQDRRLGLGDFVKFFIFPIFAAHKAMFEPFLRNVLEAIKATPAFTHSEMHRDLALQAASISKLSPPVFTLAFHQQHAAYGAHLSRMPTMHEQAYTASIPGRTDTRRMHTSAMTDNSGCLTRIPRADIQDTDRSTFPIEITAANSQVLQFNETSDTGWFGLHGINNPPLPREYRTLLLGPPTGPKPTPRRLGTDSVIPTKPEAPPITLENSPIFRILSLDIPKVPSPQRTRPQSPPFGRSSRRLRSSSTAPGTQTGSQSIPQVVVADAVVSDSNTNLPPKRRPKTYYYVNQDTGEQMPSPPRKRQRKE
ncbi:hypothetical protein DFP72DRAFT_848453 [Ephemerocybe angulata]|uniref:Uncharacterized protein n=1 Tax=Ephemerocybe angulata TaxID=980116 RepID=A0A8H6HXP5_9AGAR|nr:hypothetical protein DFP72DRAFT_848453 [Tulosesus angulatus]